MQSTPIIAGSYLRSGCTTSARTSPASSHRRVALLYLLLTVLLFGGSACGPQPQPQEPSNNDKVAKQTEQVSDAKAEATSNEVSPEPEYWEGSIELPGMKLDFHAELRPTDDGYSGSLDIPQQGAEDLPLGGITVEDDRRAFTLDSVGASWEFEVAEDGQSGSGTFTQQGQEFPFTVERKSEPRTVVRPQTPQPPFPYTPEEIQFENTADSTVLAGTLTIPQGDGPHPAVVLVTGSGAQDRDETIFGHKPFLVIADHLSKNGIAVLRYDDRGVGGSTTTNLNVGTLELAGDAAAGVDFLQSREDIDGDQIGILGHSEGGIIAPIVASERQDVAFIVLLAGTGVPGDQVLAAQLRAMYEAFGVPDEEIDAVVKAYETAIPVLADPDANREEREEAARPLVEAQVEVMTRYMGETTDVESELGVAVEMMQQKWMQTFVRLDPRDYLKKVTIPVLALNGTLDKQVLPEQNLPEIKKALEEAGNETVVIQRLEGLNHLFQTAKTGVPAEYASIEETVSPVALDAITVWIREQTR